MYVDLRNIEERDDGFIYIINQWGIVVQLPIECRTDLDKYASNTMLSPDAPEFICELADAGILAFDNYDAREDKFYYDDALLNSQDDVPVYPGPVIAHLAITERCNMSCDYCSVRGIHSNIADVETIETYKHMIDVLADSGAFQIGLTGGEPTLHSGICELVKYIVSKGIACNITTNGWQVSDVLADKLLAAGLTQVQISLDAPIPEIHEKHRTHGSFSRALETAHKFMDRGLIVGCDCVVSSENIDYIDDFIPFLEKHGFRGLTLIKLKQGDLPLSVFKESMVDYDEYAALIDRVCRLESSMEITVDCASVSNLCSTLTEEEQTQIHSAGCPAGHTLISVAPNGDVYPCAALTLPEFKIGNLLDEDFSDLWNNSPTMRNLRNIKNNVIGKCRKCAKLDVCRGGCRGIALSLSDDISSSDPSCLYKV